jgi:hypothetical protein
MDRKNPPGASRGCSHRPARPKPQANYWSSAARGCCRRSAIGAVAERAWSQLDFSSALAAASSNTVLPSAGITSILFGRDLDLSGMSNTLLTWSVPEKHNDGMAREQLQ